MDDRTSEFFALAKSVPGGSSALSSSGLNSNGGRYGNYNSNNVLQNATVAPSAGGSSGANEELRSFHTTASGISRDIAATSALLSELTQLVRQKSIFTDDSNRINSLVMKIKQNIENLNGRLDEAGSIIAQHKRRAGKNSQAGQQASNLVEQLKEEFVEATGGFKKVLQQRTDVMKETTNLKKKVYGGNDTDNNNDKDSNVELVSLEKKPPVYHDYATPLSGVGGGGLNLSAGGPMMQGFPTIDLTSAMAPGESSSSASHLPRPHGARGSDNLRYRSQSSADSYEAIPNLSSGNAYSGLYGNNKSTPLTPLDIKRMEEESGQDQLMQLIPDQDYLREREQAMSEVETNIVELGTIFNKLAVMVSEHREMVHRIEDNVDDANTNINLSLATLTDTLTNLQTNRALMFKIFGVLILFIILFVVFLA